MPPTRERHLISTSENIFKVLHARQEINVGFINPMVRRPGGALQAGMFIKFGTGTPSKASVQLRIYNFSFIKKNFEQRIPQLTGMSTLSAARAFKPNQCSFQTTASLQFPMIFLHVHQAIYDRFPMKRQLQFRHFY